MTLLRIPAGSHVLIGRPAQPVSKTVIHAVHKLLLAFPSIAEAHLPQCFVRDKMERPAQVLVVVFEQDAESEQVLADLIVAMGTVLPAGVHLDVWPIDLGSELLLHVRATGCQLF